MDREDLQFFLLNIVRQIGVIPHDDLEEHVEYARSEFRRAEGIGPLLDPTGWIKASHTGEFDLAKSQLKLIELILDIRKEMNNAEALRLEYIEKSKLYRR